MRFQDLENDLPNGFHDAKLTNISIDYAQRSISMQMKIWIGMMGTPNQEEYRSATLNITEFYFCVIDPPDLRYPFVTKGKPLCVSGDEGWPEILKYLATWLAQSHPESTYHRFFVVDWNAFIYIAAETVQLLWTK